MTFSVKVLDPNIEDELWARWVILGAGQDRMLSPCNGELEPGRLIPVSGSEIRDLSFTLEPSQVLQNGCYEIRLAVTDTFATSCRLARQNPRVAPLGTPSSNVDVATWWLVASDDPVANVDLQAMCESRPVESSSQ